MSWKAEDFDSEWPFHEQATKFELKNNKAALLVIDIQKGDLVKDTDSEYGIKYPYIVEYWNKRIADFVLPNTSRLISFFRKYLYSKFYFWAQPKYNILRILDY